MKRSKLIIGALGVVSVAISVWIGSTFNQEDVAAKYVATRGSLDIDLSAKEYQDWVKTKMIDVETNDVITPERLQEILAGHKMQPKALTVDWREHGPDNIAGRTRALHVDYTNQIRIWSGGVTGGLYKSENRANLWSRVDNFPGNQFISSIAQDGDGNVYVATGSVDEGSNWTGNGLYVTTDAAESWTLVPGTGNFSRINKVVGTRLTKDIFFTTNQGLRKYNHTTGQLEQVPGYGSNTARSLEISKDGSVLVCSDAGHRTFVSTDGGVTWDNKSGGQSGQIATSSIARIEYAISSKKDDGKHSIYASTANSSFQGGSNNQGQWISLDNGDTWHRHTPATEASIGNGVIDFRGQGTWNNVCSFDPTDPTRVIVGGIDLHEWKQVINNPPSGGWNQISIWNTSPTHPTLGKFYVHADNHALTWDDDNRLFVGNDGGVQISLDLGNTFYPANRGYNITQFFKIAYDRDGSVLGGTQDNGSLYNNHKNTTYQEFRQIFGGDGFSAVISFFNPKILITSSQFNRLGRSADAGNSMNIYLPDWPSNTYGPTGEPGGAHPFHTMIFLEEYYDTNSEDSVTFIPQKSFNSGDVLEVPSLTTGVTIDYVTPVNLYFSDTVIYNPALTETQYVVRDSITDVTYDLGLFAFTPFPSASQQYPPVIGDSLSVVGPTGVPVTVVVAEVNAYDFYVGENPETGKRINMVRDTILLDIPWDTIRVQDPYQSWFFVSTSRNGGELWGTRDALRLAYGEPKWALIARDLGGSAVDVEFSADLNHVFVCGGPFIGSTDLSINGPIHRIDGLASVYSSDPDFINKVDVTKVSHTTSKTRIGGNSNFHGIGIDPNNPDVLVATSGFNGNVFRTNNATAPVPTFTNVGSQGGLAFYDVIVDKDDNDILFAATNVGVSVSENGGATWSDVTHPSFSGVPCYHIMQSWRTWEEGNKRSGEIYVGTHGRGIWSTEAVLSVANNHNDNNPGSFTKKENNIKVYPNPSAGNSTLEVKLHDAGDASIMFFNLAGTLVKTVDVSGLTKGKNEVKFDATELPEGTYLIKVSSNRQVETTKFIKY